MASMHCPGRKRQSAPQQSGETMKGVVDFFADLAKSDPFFGALAGTAGGSDRGHTTSKPLTVRSADQMLRVSIGEARILPPLVVSVKPRPAS